MLGARSEALDGSESGCSLGNRFRVAASVFYGKAFLFSPDGFSDLKVVEMAQGLTMKLAQLGRIHSK